MADKRRFTVSLPDHVADAVEKQAKPVGSTPTEYAADVIRWWFGQGCPPVTPDEIALRSAKLAAEWAKRVKPLPKNLSAWNLAKDETYVITDDAVVQFLLTELGVPNLFAQHSEHDEVRMSVCFDNHPTHWISLDFFKGTKTPGGDGLTFEALPKNSVSRDEMMERIKAEARKMEWKGTVSFSQLPEISKKHPTLSQKLEA